MNILALYVLKISGKSFKSQVKIPCTPKAERFATYLDLADNIYKHTSPEMTEIINILIRCEFAYHVEFGFICEY